MKVVELHRSLNLQQELEAVMQEVYERKDAVSAVLVVEGAESFTVHCCGLTGDNIRTAGVLQSAILELLSPSE